MAFFHFDVQEKKYFMEIFHWNEQLDTSLAYVDRQHHRLADFMNDSGEVFLESKIKLEEKVTMRTREFRKARLSLERFSLTDFLTRLPDRKYGMQMLTHRMEETWQ